jgi:hypothetical protein
MHQTQTNTLARRDFLKVGLAAGAAVSTALTTRAAEKTAPPIIDTNVWLGRWPIRRLRLEEPAPLAEKLKSNGVTRAWASSLEAILHKDIAGVNARLAETCRQFPMFVPFGAVNLALPRWERDIEACAAAKMAGIRLLPGYHGYKLDDARLVDALKLATEKRLAVQFSLALEDERTQNPLMRVPVPDISPLPKTLAAAPGARVMILNWLRSMAGKPVLMALGGTPLLFDIGLLEGIGGIEAALEELPAERLCFGSYAPVFYHEAAKLKLQESELTDSQMNKITHENAEQFLQG